MRFNKYGNHKVKINGMTFDSNREYERWCELRLLERAKRITDLQRQVKIPLQDGFTLNGKRYQPITYVADFVYTRDGETIVEDAKGYKTDVYQLKKKMYAFRYGKEINEV